MHQGRRLWLLAGTGEGPVLAAHLLQCGWGLQVSVVSAAAARPYRQLSGSGVLDVRVGALEGPAAMAAVLQQAATAGMPFAAVIDATHPFATTVSGALRQACRLLSLPLLRLGRAPLPLAGARLLHRLDDLQSLNLRGERLLLALGARQLAAAVAASPGALHHARVLPAPGALQQALAAGLPQARLAVLRPGQDFAVEGALVRRWQISVIVCRQSGGVTEAGWRQVSGQQPCRLLLLARPEATAEPRPLSLAELLTKLETLGEATDDA